MKTFEFCSVKFLIYFFPLNIKICCFFFLARESKSTLAHLILVDKFQIWKYLSRAKKIGFPGQTLTHTNHQFLLNGTLFIYIYRVFFCFPLSLSSPHTEHRDTFLSRSEPNKTTRQPRELSSAPLFSIFQCHLLFHCDCDQHFYFPR